MFIYPPKVSPDVPKKNPFQSENWNFWEKRFWKCWLSPCDPKEWEPSVQKMLQYYQNLLLFRNGRMYLKKGTILYHGSYNYPFSVETKNRFTFFGLDVVISLWYILEMSYFFMDRTCRVENKKQVRTTGYLYEFQLKKNLEVTHIIKKLIQNPKNIKRCSQSPRAVCLHPQVSFHGRDSAFRTLPHVFDLCNEVTLYYDYYKEVLGDPVQVYLVDTYALHKNRNNPLYDPVQSIVSKKTKKPDKTKSCGEYVQTFRQE